MKFGFDLDGVLLTQSTTEIVLMKNNELAEEVYYETRQPNLNPFLFMSENDKAVIITARRSSLAKVTKKMCKRFFPTLKFIMLSVLNGRLLAILTSGLGR